MAKSVGWNFGKLKLTNVVYFDQAEIDLGYKGVTVIKGLNKNSRLQRKSRNGVGKSLLLAALPNLIANSSPTVSLGKRSSGAKSSLLVKPKSSIELEVRARGADWTLKKYRDKSASVKYTILENGKDKQFPTATKAESFIGEELFPISEREFYSYVYLHGTRTFPLQMGSSTERMQFFSDMFHLEKFDLVRAACNARKSELRDSETRVKELRKQLAELDKEVGDVDVVALKALSDKYARQIEKLNNTASRLHKLQRLHAVYSTHAKAWDAIDKSVPLKQQLKALTKKLEALDEQQEEWRKYERYLDKLEEWKADSAKAREKSEGHTLEECQKLIDKESTERRLIERELDSLTDPKKPDSVEAVEFDPADYKLEGKTHEEWIKAAKAEAARFDALIGLQKQINKIGSKGGKCFVCGSKGGRVEDHLEEYEKQAKRWRKVVGKIEDALEYAEWVVEDANYRAKLSEVKAARKALGKKLEALPDVSKYRKVMKHLEWLEENPKPKWKRDVPEKPNAKGRDKLVALQTQLRALMPVEEVLREASDIDPADIARVDADYKEVREKLTRLTTKRAQIEPRIENHNRLDKKCKELRQEVRDIETGLQDAPILDSLIDIYSKNGRKLEVMQQFAASLEQHMNSNSPLLFPEPMRFDFVVEPNNFGIIVTRGTGKDAIASDVRFLSGAESRQFNLCLVKSLLPMIPASRRSNIIVLDELEANMSEAAADLYRNDFIPALQKVVPHVIVITPQEDAYPGARVLQVVKEGNVSKVISLGIDH